MKEKQTEEKSVLFSLGWVTSLEKKISELKKEIELGNAQYNFLRKKEMAMSIIMSRVVGVLQSKPKSEWEEEIFKLFEASKRIHQSQFGDELKNALDWLEQPIEFPE